MEKQQKSSVEQSQKVPSQEEIKAAIAAQIAEGKLSKKLARKLLKIDTPDERAATAQWLADNAELQAYVDRLLAAKVLTAEETKSYREDPSPREGIILLRYEEAMHTCKALIAKLFPDDYNRQRMLTDRILFPESTIKNFPAHLEHIEKYNAVYGKIVAALEEKKLKPEDLFMARFTDPPEELEAWLTACLKRAALIRRYLEERYITETDIQKALHMEPQKGIAYLEKKAREHDVAIAEAEIKNMEN